MQQSPSRYPTVFLLVWLSGVVVVATVWFLRRRQVIAIRKRAIPANGGREAMLLHRISSNRIVPVLLTDERVEPGIVGISQPVLIWPIELSDKLDDEQME